MDTLIALIAAAVPVAVGALVLIRSDQRRIGWLLVAHGLCIGLFLGLPEQPATSRPGMVADQLMAGTWTLLFLWLVLIAYLLPDGHPASPRQRTWIRLGLVGNVIFWIGAAGDPSLFEPGPLPVPWLPSVVSVAVGVVGLIWVVVVLLRFGGLGAPTATPVRRRRPAAAAVVPLRRTERPCRAAAELGVVLPPRRPLPRRPVRGRPGDVRAATCNRHRDRADQAVRHRARAQPDPDLRRTDASRPWRVTPGCWRSPAWLFGNSTAGGMVAVAVVAVAAAPTQRWLRQSHRALGLWLPVRAPTRRADDVRARGSSRPDSPCSRPSPTRSLRRSWCNGLDRAHAAPQTADAQRAARPPGAPGYAARLPRRRGAARSVVLRRRYACCTTWPGRQRSWSAPRQLTADLQASRSRIVAAREEERKRLRRDLHDGVGPVPGRDRAQAQRRRDPRPTAPTRNALLAEIRDEVKDAIAEVRRLVDDLRPPAIDEVGLVGAIRQRAAALSTDSLDIRRTGPDELPPLPAAVEVAAYRIASEAMTNVAKHSGASRCTRRPRGRRNTRA